MKKKSLFIGKDILNSNIDTLQPVSLKELFVQITEPATGLIKLTTQLMKVMSVDEKAYHKQKTKLPYFIGAVFENNLRKTKNFIEINWVIVDIDKCFQTLEKELEMKTILQQDNRIALMFTSPSNLGLKLVFQLSEPIVDSALYTNFYKGFTSELARHYKLEKFIDFKTSDVTRVSFLNADAHAWLNENATLVVWKDYISPYDAFNQEDESINNRQNEEKPKKGPNDDVYAEILQKLNPKTPKRQKMIFVPEVLNSIVRPVTDYATELGLTVKEVRDIHYGKKFVFEKGYDFAEINVFYGKSGFTLVNTPKRGYSPALSEVAQATIEKVLFDNSTSPDPDDLKNPDIFSPGEIIKDIKLN